MIQNGLQYELTEHNLNMKFHGLSSDIIKIGKSWLNTESTNPISQSELTLKLFEFKLFGFAVFLNKLRVDNYDIFRNFARVCLSQLTKELDGLELRAEEEGCMYFYLPGFVHRDQQYLVEKLQDYMQDIENYTKNGIYPRFSQVSILEMPLDHAQEVHYKIQTTSIIPEFIESYKECLEKLEFRYNQTPGVKTQEEIDQQKQKFASIPEGSVRMNPNGIDGFNFGQSTSDIREKLGTPEDKYNPKYPRNIDEFLSYKKLGVSFGFKNNSLVVINIYSGRPEAWGDTNFQKYQFQENVPFSMDSYYNDILKLYGPPIEEKDFPKAKIYSKELDYGRYSFSFYVETEQIYCFQYKSEDFK
ncbi:MAG: hypothetical protein O2862_01590 [Bacteroidetes bacterium]|nr:hypothetical protein [Bacteroidota bacterium]